MPSSAASAAHEVAINFLTVFPDDVEPLVPAEEPAELDFLEIVPCFHSGETIRAMLPRTPATYEHSIAKYVRMLTLIASMCASAVVAQGAGAAVYTVDPAVQRFLYETFDVCIEYPFTNVLYRIKRGIASVIANPTPSFQRVFMKDLPNEMISMIASAVGEGDRLAFSQTCAGIRRILLVRAYDTAHFALKYQNWVLHGPSSSSEDALHLDVVEAMTSARNHLLESFTSFLNTRVAVKHVRILSFDNQWGRMWPDFLPGGRLVPRSWNTEIYDPIYLAMIDLLAAVGAKHVRFVSFVFTRRLSDYLAAHPTIVGLSIERYGSAYPIPSYFNQGMVQLPRIVFLGIRFDVELGVHRRNWSILSLCPNVRQLHAYVDPESRFGFVFPFFHSASQHLHRLESIHFQGCTGNIDVLISWLAGAAISAQVPSSLRRLKIHAIRAIAHEDVFWLVSILGAYYSGLRVLIVEGIDSVQPYLLEHIGASLRRLEALTILRRAGHTQICDRLCIWDRDCFEYAEALRGCSSLYHLEVNMYWTTDAWSPRALDDMLAIAAGRCIREDPRVYIDKSDATPCDGTRCDALHPPTEPLDHLHDGSSVAIPFVAHLHTLRTFAIRSSSTHYSCVIDRSGPLGESVLTDVISEHHHAFPYVNPFGENTWKLRALV
ncbi:hypothetical protein AURDEDRAFT_173646 [Auricularia subglabra TFB-10046 SS5]|nr:hypothetical protein AURDEDRAFT_173646 [Auricularia subglabra TFB-10046 SS5]